MTVAVLTNILSIASSETTQAIEVCDCELAGANWMYCCVVKPVMHIISMGLRYVAQCKVFRHSVV